MAQVTLRDYLQETEDANSAERVDDALTHCQTVLTQFPESLEAQRLIGEVYLALERLNEAQQSFDWVLTNDPENVVTYCDRALISERTSDYDTALDCYQQAYELSHGNSHIRQEFNQLSTRVGQQGFMLSRAGLARLYMRGDLLTQAIQEWEAVLALSPDRLDARIGLLETYWREGIYDRVEQLATQVLRDVPSCLKALLLLAYVTAAKDMQKAQELLRRAEILDPDSVMAHEIFADALASQPSEPFLQLLRKPPTLVETSPSAATYTRREEEPTRFPADASTTANSRPAWSSAEWGSGATWNSDTLIGTQNPQSEQNALAAQAGAPIDDVWSALERQPEAPPPAAQESDSSTWSAYESPVQQEDQTESTWQEQLQNASASDQTQNEPVVWDSAAFDRFKEPSYSGLETWEPVNGNADAASAWSSYAKEAEAPPAWLNTLTQSERGQASKPLSSPPAPASAAPTQPPATPAQPPATPFQPPATPTPPIEAAAHPQPVQKDMPTRKEEPVESTDDEPFSFGPEWLKSLGAASLDSTGTMRALPSVSSAPESSAANTPEAPRQEAAPEPQSSKSQAPTMSEDQRMLKALEELEADMRSQGFIPMEPKSFSALAQENAPSKQPSEIRELDQENTNGYKEPELSSALAELGNYAHSSPLDAPSEEDSQEEPAAPDNESSWLSALGNNASASPSEEPTWISSLNSVPSPSPDQIAQDETMANMFASPEQPFWAELGAQDFSSQEESSESASSERKESVASEPQQDAGPEPIAVSPVTLPQESNEATLGVSSTWPTWIEDNEPQAASVEPASNARANMPSGQLAQAPTQNKEVQEAPQPPAPPRREPMFDAALETTMKRPAVRLQPLQSSSQNDVASSNRTRGSERTASGRASDANMNSQERLLKGYQHQLYGEYDEAMQEYRVIIRSAPELLGDVVSNVRALLKLAPKYSAGYRVLGDAYMRQGEYLQAMEAYNKALTMAKRAKG